MKRNKKHSIKSRISRLVLIMSVFLIITLCVLLGIFLEQKVVKTFADETHAYAVTAAKLIDGDRVRGYLDAYNADPGGNVKDEYYQDFQHYLDTARESSKIVYFYVFVPEEDGLRYVWASGDITDPETFDLGTMEPYTKSGLEAMQDALDGDEKYHLSIEEDEDYGSIGSVYYPIKDSSGEVTALVGVDISMPELRSYITELILIITIGCIGIVYIFGVILYLQMTKSLFVPLLTLNEATRNMVDHLEAEENAVIKITSDDEIGELTKSFNQMYHGVRNYIQELAAVTAEKERIGAELDIATRIQKSMLPMDFNLFPGENIVNIYADMDPAKEVGGDFYDFFMVDKTHLAIVVADVSGKGVPAALFMVIGKTLIQDHTLYAKDLGEVFSEVNNLLCKGNSEDLFITAFEGILDLETGEFRFVNAGHEHPYIYRAGGTFERHPDRAGFILAELENIKWRSGVLQLNPGDRIFQFTDGVTEAHNEKDELYGRERLQETLNRNAEKPVRELIEEVREDIRRYSGEAEQFDDITMLCLEFVKKK